MNCELVEKVSKKTGKKYYCLEIEIIPNYKKYVFLDSAELALVLMTTGV